MRTRNSLCAGLAAILMSLWYCAAALAGPAESEAWFNALPKADRVEIQRDLALLGYYDALVDGEFGARSYSAVNAYRASRGESAGGVLSDADLSRLHETAEAVYARYGFAESEDRDAHLGILVPTALFGPPTHSPRGTAYVSADGRFSLETRRVPADERDFAALFVSMRDDQARRITYSALGQSSFSVSGWVDGRQFYARFYRGVDESVGYVLSWDEAVEDQGAMLAAFLASYSAPLTAVSTPDMAAEVDAGSGPATEPARRPAAAPLPAAGATEVPLEDDGGTFRVPVRINDAITLKFTLDSGAADVSIPADVVLTLMRAGTIGQNDFLGKQSYTLADGSTVPSETFLIHSLETGGIVIHDVKGSIASVEGSLLLGQSFLKHFRAWSIDNARHVLVLTPRAEEAASGAPTDPGATHRPPDSSGAAMDRPGAEAAPLAIYGGLDFYGGDIFKGHTTDVVECTAACARDRQCKAFTFNADPSIRTGPNCFLKSGVDRLEAYSSAISGLFLGAEAGSAQTYRFSAIDPTADLKIDYDFPGHDLFQHPYAGARTLDDCRMACIDMGACQAFSYVSRLRQCWLKSIAGPGRPARGIVSGTKRFISVPPIDVLSVPR